MGRVVQGVVPQALAPLLREEMEPLAGVEAEEGQVHQPPTQEETVVAIRRSMESLALVEEAVAGLQIPPMRQMAVLEEPMAEEAQEVGQTSTEMRETGVQVVKASL